VCYSGKCKYEDAFGDCHLPSKYFHPPLKIPEDAYCIITNDMMRAEEESPDTGKEE
jgi:hypothetical protein